MHAHTAKVSASIRDQFLADHDRLEALFERLLAAFEANDRGDMARLWTDLYQWADDRLGQAEKEFLFQSFAERLRARPTRPPRAARA